MHVEVRKISRAICTYYDRDDIFFVTVTDVMRTASNVSARERDISHISQPNGPKMDDGTGADLRDVSEAAGGRNRIVFIRMLGIQ